MISMICFQTAGGDKMTKTELDALSEKIAPHCRKIRC